MFKALVLKQENNNTLASIEMLDEKQLPEGKVLLNIAYSSLNYKDGLAITGKGKIIRQFPMIPGIDCVASVEESSDPRYQKGDKVILTGWGIGENHWGGMAEKARVNADYLVPLPKTLTSKQAMIIGTAGLTAMLCVQALIDAGINKGEILVTGASGGVGSAAVCLLSQLGYQVCALTGRKKDNEEFLRQLGASSVIERSEFESPARPLDKERWAGAVDTVGSTILAKALSQMAYNGAVAACGLAAGFELPTTVMPFILRNVSLLGIDSVKCPQNKRLQAWQQLAELLPAHYYQQACKEIQLEEVVEQAKNITQGQITGRVLIKL